MGVHGLWTLLEPCGRRIDIKALRNKTLAIDASGWIFRFLKAMRDDQGDILPNAHTIGFLRRICKLLYLNIRPVFVFDGSTPALKRRTVVERRRRREQQDSRVRKTAEKLLMNRLKQHAIREIGKQTDTASVGNRDISEESKSQCHQAGTEEIERIAKVEDKVNEKTSSSIDTNTSDGSDNDIGFEVDVASGVDPEVLSTLPPSMQLEIMLQLREKAMAAARGGLESRCNKPEEFSQYQIQQYLNSTGLRRKLDAIRGMGQQNFNVEKPVAGEQDKHYVLFKENDEKIPNVSSEDIHSKVPESKALNISFCVQEEETDAEDLDWEDVQGGTNGGQGVEHSRSKYWTLSHGFQKGRSLGNWGHEKAMSAEGVSSEEQAMIDEAIKNSLQVQGTSDNMQKNEISIEKEAHGNTNIVLSSTDRGKDEPNMTMLMPDRSCSATIEGKDISDLATRSDQSKQMSPNINALMIEKHDKPNPSERQGVLNLTENHPSLECSVKYSADIIAGEKDEKNETNDIRKSKSKSLVFRDSRSTSSVDKVAHTVRQDQTDPNLEDTVKDRAFLELDWESNKIQANYSESQEIIKMSKNEYEQADSTRVNDTGKEMLDLQELAREEAILRSDKRAATGQSDSPTEQMFTECQELLQMFGIPYIIAPTEAEAQCAWLDANGLVDGVVTDDNDAFLFGAKRVYRHIFEENKYVEEYRSDDIERELGLSRDGLVLMALLLGSDYTPGIAGVGIVNAVEIVSTFLGFDGLVEFREWVNNIDEDIVAFVSDEPIKSRHISGTDEFKMKHKTIRKSWVLPEDFPSQEVIDSYLKPALDSSKSKFTFVTPDFSMLASFCTKKFGWDEGKIHDIFEPVKKSLNERNKQQTLMGFVTFREKFARVRSKRLAKAVEKAKKKMSKTQDS